MLTKQRRTSMTKDEVIAGALFDFMGWLTSRKERIVLSSADEASPAVDAIKDFAKMRGLSLDNAQVQTWQEALAQPAPVQEPVKIVAYNCKCGRTMKFESEHGVVAPQRTWVGLTDEEFDFLVPYCHNEFDLNDYKEFARAIEAKLKKKNHD
jgi:hypothetical protein